MKDWLNIMSQPQRPTLTQHDNHEKWRCPQLGGPVTFAYCRRMNVGLPCNKLYQCWQNELNVQQFLDDNFTPEEIEKTFASPHSGRMGTIFDALKSVTQNKDK